MRRRTGDVVEIDGDYQHRALTEGSAIQRFWHCSKQLSIRKHLPPAPSDEIIDVDGNSDAMDIARKSHGRPNVTFQGPSPFVVPDRISGVSNWSCLQLTGLALTSPIAFTNLPARFSGLIGVAFFVFALSLGICTVVLQVIGSPVSGFTTVILLQLIIGSGLFFALGVLGEYLGRVYDEPENRPRYIVAETTGPEDSERWKSETHRHSGQRS
jgi:energy-converting hydrogenase Eha subunit A